MMMMMMMMMMMIGKKAVNKFAVILWLKKYCDAEVRHNCEVLVFLNWS
jgi:hypothetical protein